MREVKRRQSEHHSFQRQASAWDTCEHAAGRGRHFLLFHPCFILAKTRPEAERNTRCCPPNPFARRYVDGKELFRWPTGPTTNPDTEAGAGDIEAPEAVVVPDIRERDLASVAELHGDPGNSTNPERDECVQSSYFYWASRSLSSFCLRFSYNKEKTFWESCGTTCLTQKVKLSSREGVET